MEVEDKVMLRHKLGGDFCIWGSCRDTCGGDGSIETAAVAAAADRSSLEAARATRHLRVVIESECKGPFTALESAAAEVAEAQARHDKLLSPKGATTHEAALVQNVIHSPPLESHAKMQALDSPARKQVHARMAEGVLELDDLKEHLQHIQDKPTAMSTLEQFNDAFVNKTFVEKSHQ